MAFREVWSRYRSQEETEEEHFNILKRNEKFLKQKMFVENKFVDILLQKKIIDSDECNDLKCTLQRNVEEEAVSALIKCMMMKDRRKVILFIKELMEDDQGRVADRLKNSFGCLTPQEERILNKPRYPKVGHCETSEPTKEGHGEQDSKRLESTEKEHCRILKKNEELIKRKITLEKSLIDIFLHRISGLDECDDEKRMPQRIREAEAVSFPIKLHCICLIEVVKVIMNSQNTRQILIRFQNDAEALQRISENSVNALNDLPRYVRQEMDNIFSTAQIQEDCKKKTGDQEPCESSKTDEELNTGEIAAICKAESIDEHFNCSDDDTEEISDTLSSSSDEDMDRDEINDTASSSSDDTEDTTAMSEIISKITRDENVYPWLESIAKTENKIELVVKLQSKGKAQKYVSGNFKENGPVFDIKEGDVHFLVKDWELLKGAKVKPYEHINICEVVKEVTPLPRIEKICEENYGYGTLGCFAINEEGQPFAITAQHVLCKENHEKNKNRYIFSEVSKQEQGTQSKHTIMLSTCSSGFLNVKCINQKDIYLDIAMMKLSNSLMNEHKVQITEKLHVELVKKGEKVFKIGAETGETTGTVTKTWLRLNNEFSEDIRFGKVFCVKGDGMKTPFAEGGDSGSLVYSLRKGKKCALGILFKAVKDSEGSFRNGTFYCVHLKYCMEDLKLTLYDEVTPAENSTNGVTLLSHRDVYEHYKCPYEMNPCEQTVVASVSL